MKRLFSLLLCVMMLLATINVSASQPMVIVSNADCDPGETVDVTVAIEGNTGFANLGIEIGYDSNVLTLEKVVGGNVGVTFVSAQNIAENPYNMNWYGLENTTYNGTLATLTFKVAENAPRGNHIVTVDYYKGRDGNYTDGYDVNYDENGDPVYLHYVSGTLKVGVKDVTDIKISKDFLELTEGETETLTATITPADATDKTVVWSSSDENVATVVDGVVTAVGEGTAMISAKAGTFEVHCEVTVNAGAVSVENVVLDKTSLTLTEGEAETLTATVTPVDATDKTVVWSSSDENVATVVDGVVTAVGEGTATITATAGEKSATCEVTVKAGVVNVEDVELDKTSLTLTEGEAETLTATVTPIDATDKTVVWSSSDENVATVIDGVVTAVGEGTATITAAAGEKSATCEVTVNAIELPFEAVDIIVDAYENGVSVSGKFVDEDTTYDRVVIVYTYFKDGKPYSVSSSYATINEKGEVEFEGEYNTNVNGEWAIGGVSIYVDTTPMEIISGANLGTSVGCYK